MESYVSYIACLTGAYLLGAIPFGFLIAKSHGIDIRTVGSGNIGATNVFRAVSKKLGILTFALDVLKGFVAAYFFPVIATRVTHAPTGESLNLLCACLAVIGHNWPVYLHFKGGKGIATTAGVLLGVAPAALGIGLAVWLIVFPISRFVSLASICAAIAVPIAGWMLYISNGLLIPSFLSAFAVLAILRHKPNIQRLIKGTENRFEFKRKKQCSTK